MSFRTYVIVLCTTVAVMGLALVNVARETVRKRDAFYNDHGCHDVVGGYICRDGAVER